MFKKNASGKTQRITIGNFPDESVFQARELTRTALENFSAGIYPTEEKKRQKVKSITLGLLLDKYLAHKNLKPYTTELSAKALKQLGKINKPERDQVWRFINETLPAIENPRGTGKALQGSLRGLWRYRVGNYRLICQIKDGELVIWR